MRNYHLTRIADRANAKTIAAKFIAEKATLQRFGSKPAKPEKTSDHPCHIPLKIKRLKTIEVRPEYHDKLLEHLSFSQRLKHILQYLGCKSLGDLQGAQYTDLFQMRGMGQSTLMELRELQCSETQLKRDKLEQWLRLAKMGLLDGSEPTITDEKLAHWLKGNIHRPAYPLKVYARLLNLLLPAIFKVDYVSNGKNWKGL